MSNLQAFLKMIILSELGQSLIDVSDRGYNILVGSTASHPLLFTDYSTHPNILNKQFDSTAAGAYQIIHPTFIGLCEHGGYTDFTPETQDKMAVDLITGREALDDVNAGNFENAVAKCSAEWASLPGGNSGQHSNSINLLWLYYTKNGGTHG